MNDKQQRDDDFDDYQIDCIARGLTAALKLTLAMVAPWGSNKQTVAVLKRYRLIEKSGSAWRRTKLGDRVLHKVCEMEPVRVSSTNWGSD